MTSMMRKFTRFFGGLALGTTFCAALVLTALPGRATAQGLFDAVITVNNAPITRFELEQRARMLQLLRAPGDPQKLAREQLIEDKLKLQAARSVGYEVSEEELQIAMDRFASRANLTGAELVKLLGQAGVAEETYRDFVRAGFTWAELTRAKFGPRVAVTEDDLERARQATGTAGGVQVLLSEIIMPYTPATQAQVEERARRIAEIDSESAFSAQARRYSATRTAGRGGRMPWTPIGQLPPVLQGIVLGLAPGDVSDPLPLQGAIALFQLRDIMETDVPDPTYAAIEYAAYYIDGGRSEAALKRAHVIEEGTDTCDDLYGIAQGQPTSVLERGSKAPGEIPSDIAIELAKLDPGEVSTAITRANGQTLVLLMLCGRSLQIEEDPAVTADAGETTADSEEGEAAAIALSQTQILSERIGNQRLESYAEGYLAQLLAEARIVEN